MTPVTEIWAPAWSTDEGLTLALRSTAAAFEGSINPRDWVSPRDVALLRCAADRIDVSTATPPPPAVVFALWASNEYFQDQLLGLYPTADDAKASNEYIRHHGFEWYDHEGRADNVVSELGDYTIQRIVLGERYQ